MQDDFAGYLVFGSSEKSEPIGVVSNTYRRQISSYIIPERIKNIFLLVEDRRFFKHFGFDLIAIGRAILANAVAGKVLQGGSTITQQLARQILKDNRKTYYRKWKELIYAIRLELRFNKEQILTQYFDSLYFGGNIYGMRTASIFYFGKEIEHLKNSEIIFLLTIIRGPNYYFKNPEKLTARYNFLNGLVLEKNLQRFKTYKKNLNFKFQLESNKLEVYSNNLIPYITETKIEKSKKIISTINNDLQSTIKNYISKSKRRLSIIVIKDNKILAVESNFGKDYVFNFKFNVGSTLKPFVYYHLRKVGVSKNQMYNATRNNIWKVREAGFYSDYLSLQKALFFSNNNTFINAISEIGFENLYSFLSEILNKQEGEFFHSSILGATRSGLSLYELATVYNRFFSNDIDEIKTETKEILNRVARSKLNINIENAFLKTGTTNNNNEKIAITNFEDTTVAILSQENDETDYSKEGSFLKEMKTVLRGVLGYNKEKNYKWT